MQHHLLNYYSRHLWQMVKGFVLDQSKSQTKQAFYWRLREEEKGEA